MNLLLILIGIVAVYLLYVAWRNAVNVLEKYVAFVQESTRYKTTFDVFWFPLIIGGLLGLIIGRLFFVIDNWHLYQQVRWSVFPYLREGDHTVWFSFMPWKLLRVGEGVTWLAVPITVALFFGWYGTRFFKHIRENLELTSEFETLFMRGIGAMIRYVVLLAILSIVAGYYAF